MNTVFTISKKTDFENKENEKLVKILNDSFNIDFKYTPEIHSMVVEVASDVGFIKIFQKERDKLHVFDGADYFFSQLARFQPPDYNPNFQDSNYTSTKTIGMNEIIFNNNNNKYKCKF
jgi:hypothetical protein